MAVVTAQKTHKRVLGAPLLRQVGRFGRSGRHVLRLQLGRHAAVCIKRSQYRKIVLFIARNYITTQTNSILGPIFVYIKDRFLTTCRGRPAVAK